MRYFWLLLIIIWVTADRSEAGDNLQLLEMHSADQARDWEAVGRLDLRGTGFCTGALIAPDLVLTAAHCLFDKTTGKQVEAADVEFLAGWRDGRAAARRTAKRMVINKGYSFRNNNRMERVAADIALIELDMPIRNTRIMPFGWSTRPSVGDDVQVVSYSQDRAEAPSLQETCQVLGKDPKVLVLSCQVDFGASGSPIFVVTDGVPRITSVISAKAEWNDRQVSLGASLGAPLRELVVELRQSDGVFRRIQSTSSAALSPVRSAASTSKFLRP